MKISSQTVSPTASWNAVLTTCFSFLAKNMNFFIKHLKCFELAKTPRGKTSSFSQIGPPEISNAVLTKVTDFFEPKSRIPSNHF